MSDVLEEALKYTPLKICSSLERITIIKMQILLDLAIKFNTIPIKTPTELSGNQTE